MVRTGGEERFRTEAMRLLSSADGTASADKVYFFKKLMRTNSQKEYEEPLFPGYVFLETESLSYQTVSLLKTVRGFYYFLRNNADIVRLTGSDLSAIENFSKCGEHLGFSRLYFEAGRKIVVTEGPLKGLEGNIIAVNKKRNRVTVRLDMFPQIKKIDLMYDIIEPSEMTAR